MVWSAPFCMFYSKTKQRFSRWKRPKFTTAVDACPHYSFHLNPSSFLKWSIPCKRMVCGGWNGTKELYVAWIAELVLGGEVVYSWVVKIEATLVADAVNVAQLAFCEQRLT